MFRRKKKETALQKSQREQAEYDAQVSQVRSSKDVSATSGRGTRTNVRKATEPPTFAHSRSASTRVQKSQAEGRSEPDSARDAKTMPSRSSTRPLPPPPPPSTSTAAATSIVSGGEVVYGEIDDAPPTVGEVVYGEIESERSAETTELPVYAAVQQKRPPQQNRVAPGEIIYGSADDSIPASSGQIIYGDIDSSDIRNEELQAAPLYATTMKKQGGPSTAASVSPTETSSGADEMYAVVTKKRGDSLRPESAESAPEVPPPIVSRESPSTGSLNPSEDTDGSYVNTAPRHNSPGYVNFPSANIALGEKPPVIDPERRAVEAWLKVPIERAQAQLCLQAAGLENGAYLVRKSTGGTFGLSIVSHKTIFHMKIISEKTRAGQMYLIQGDEKFGSSFPSVWELLQFYKTPTDRLTWHLEWCISETFIPAKWAPET